jgi:hypothetical protein
VFYKRETIATHDARLSNHTRRHIVVLALTLPSLTAVAAEPVPAFLEPLLADGPARTTSQVLLMVRGLAESGACARSDFYSAEVMHALLGEATNVRVDEYSTLTSVSARSLQALITDDSNLSPTLEYLKGGWLGARKPQERHRWPHACYLDATFWGEMPGLDYPSVRSVLGEGQRDDKAENSRDSHKAAHAWGGPPLRKQGSMSGAIMQYRAGSASITLTFDSNEKLHHVVASWPNDVPVPDIPR